MVLNCILCILTLLKWVPGVLMDALEGGGARDPPLDKPRVAVGEDGLPVGVHV